MWSFHTPDDSVNANETIPKERCPPPAAVMLQFAAASTERQQIDPNATNTPSESDPEPDARRHAGRVSCAKRAIAIGRKADGTIRQGHICPYNAAE